MYALYNKQTQSQLNNNNNNNKNISQVIDS
jgi:hypothetical protein